MATIADKCACSLRGRLVGDGCEICNPSIALEHAKDRIADLERTLKEIRTRLHTEGRRPEECYEMYLIDSVL